MKWTLLVLIASIPAAALIAQEQKATQKGKIEPLQTPQQKTEPMQRMGDPIQKSYSEPMGSPQQKSYAEPMGSPIQKDTPQPMGSPIQKGYSKGYGTSIQLTEEETSILEDALSSRGLRKAILKRCLARKLRNRDFGEGSFLGASEVRAPFTRVVRDGRYTSVRAPFVRVQTVR